MTEPDLVAALREAISRSGEGWQSQPSLLKRRLEQVLGSDAVPSRSQVHLLLVAAEEKVPSRLAGGPDSTALGEVAHDLAMTRGWTLAAAEWSVEIWAEALRPTSLDRTVLPDPSLLPPPLPLPPPPPARERPPPPPPFQGG